MPNHYRLQTLLEQRERALDEAEEALAQRRAEVERREGCCEEARQRLQEAQGRLAEQRQSAEEELSGGFRSGRWVEEQGFQRRLATDVQARADQVRSAEAQLAQSQHEELGARQALLHARRDLQVLEKDRERFERVERRAAERRAELAADELATARYGRS